MTITEQMAAFVVRSSYGDLSPATRDALKVRVLDSLGCALGALDGEPVRLIRDHVREFDGSSLCTLIGAGRSAPDRAAFYNGALIRYLDFNDSYLARGETCHPSDNVAPVLAAAEYAQASGKDLMTALAVAYHVQCRLSDEAPVRARGFDHTVQGGFAVAAGAARALGLDESQTANAIAIAGTAFNALRVTRTGSLSHWKGLAYPNTAFGAVHAAFLARRGITGPLEVFEGNKGLMDAITGHFAVDWSKEDLDRVTRTILKKYNAEIHSQSTIDALLELKRLESFKPEDVVRVEIDTFDVAYHIIGGGQEGDKTRVETKEQADHSLPYIVAVALLDGQVTPEQYAADRINQSDVQELLRRVFVRPVEELSKRFPDEMPARVTIPLEDGRKLVKEVSDYPGFHTRPMPWDVVVEKFQRLSAHHDAGLRSEIIAAVGNLDSISVPDLTHLLGKVIVRE